MKELIVLVGLPRSGKSTWARSQPWPIVCPDAIRLALHGQAFLPQAERLVWAHAHLMVDSLFHAGHDRIVLDATNVTCERRREWLKPNNNPAFRTLFYPVTTPLEVCLARAQASNFPEGVVRRMAQQYEPLGPDEAIFSE